MMGVLRWAPDRAPVVVRTTTGSLPSSPPSLPPVASYRATWSRTRSLGLGRYSLAPDAEGLAATRSNSLPSGSAKVVHRAVGCSTSRMGVAPRPIRRLLSASNWSARRSRCRRFLTVLGSGTLWKASRGPLVGLVASIAAFSASAPGLTGRPSTSDQNAARVEGSAQSMLRPMTDVVTVTLFPFRSDAGLHGDIRSARDGI